MIRTLLFELKKIYRLRKAWAAALAVNLVPLFLLFILVVLWVKGLFSSTGMLLDFQQEMTRKSLLGAIFVALKTFSWIAWVFVMLLAGESIAREFHEGTIKLLFTAPLSRLSLFAGKFLAVVSFYLGLLASYLTFFGLAGLFLQYGFRARLGEYIDFPGVGKILVAYLAIDLSYIALAFVLAALSSYVESTVFYNIITVLFLFLLDVSMNVLIKSGALTDGFSHMVHKLNYMRTTGVLALEEMQNYITKDGQPFPVTYENLAANALWTCFFLIAAFWLFKRRDTLS